MSCLNETLVGAVCVMLSGLALADGLATDASVPITMANLSPLPVERRVSIPEPQQYIQRDLDQARAQAPTDYPFAVNAPVQSAEFDDVYGVPVARNALMAPLPGKSAADAAKQAGGNFLEMGPNMSPKLSLIEQVNQYDQLGSKPQRRLSLTMDKWSFSATAKVAIFRQQTTEATFYVKRKF